MLLSSHPQYDLAAHHMHVQNSLFPAAPISDEMGEEMESQADTLGLPMEVPHLRCLMSRCSLMCHWALQPLAPLWVCVWPGWVAAPFASLRSSEGTRQWLVRF